MKKVKDFFCGQHLRISWNANTDGIDVSDNAFPTMKTFYYNHSNVPKRFNQINNSLNVHLSVRCSVLQRVNRFFPLKWYFSMASFRSNVAFVMASYKRA